MNTLLEKIREILGTPDFYKLMPSSSSGYQSYGWDYGAMLEYIVCAVLLMLVVGSVFKFLRLLVKR